MTDPMRPDALGFQASAPASTPPPPMIPHTPAPMTTPIPPTSASMETPSVAQATPAPVSQPAYPIPEDLAVKAQGGDTLYLGDANLAGYMPPPPAPHFAPVSGPQPSTPAVAGGPPKKRGGLLVVVFLVALLFVVVLSALGGLALRAHMRGESTESSSE